MNIIQYTDDHERFRNRLRAFLAKEVTPYVDQWEADGIVPKSAWRKMGRAGFLCMAVSPAFGGLGADFRHSVIVAEEMTRTCHAGLAASLHSDVVVPYIDTFGSDAIREKHLAGCVTGDIITALAMTEPDAGSDLAGMKTTAEEKDGMVVLNGAKIFISNGINADLVIVAARDPQETNSYQAISLYLVEAGTPGFKRGRRLKKMGFRSQDTAELFFSDCRIPEGNRLGEKGMGFLMLMEKLQQERLATAVAAVPAAEHILQYTLNWCRETVNGDKSVIRSQAVQFALVEMMTEAKLGRAFVDKLVMDHIEGRDIIVETAMAKYWTTEMAKRVADRCLDLLGNFGGLEKCPVARVWRDVRVMSIFAGTNEIMKSIAAKFMGM